MSPFDTAPDAAALQAEIHRRMGPAARLQLAIDLSALAHECVRAGIAARHPSYTPQQVTRALIQDCYRISLPRV